MSDVNWDDDKKKALKIIDKSGNLIKDLLNGSREEDYLLIREEFLSIYRDYHNSLHEIVNKRFIDLRKQVDTLYSQGDMKLVEKGLTGTELDFKYQIFNITYNKIYEEEIDNDEPDKNNKPNEGRKPKWYNRVWDKVKEIKNLPEKIKNIPEKVGDYIDDIKDGVGVINTILRSFGNAGLPTEPIDEIKELITRILKRQKDKDKQNDKETGKQK